MMPASVFRTDIRHAYARENYIMPYIGEVFASAKSSLRIASSDSCAHPQCDAGMTLPSMGRTSAAIRPFGPSPKRTSTIWPGFSSVMP